LESPQDMVANPARDQKTPSQSHSSGSYGETCMGVAERLHRNGWEPFDYPKVLAVQKPARVQMKFEYPEDRVFFANLLANGDEKKLDEEFSEYFDFRHPAIKRWEFNKVKKKLLDELVLKYDKKCQLRIHPECSQDGKFEPDHIIPLSTNELNKKLRHLVRSSSEKVLAQSFGSNHPKNLTLSCRRCNAFKKHKIIIPDSFYD